MHRFIARTLASSIFLATALVSVAASADRLEPGQGNHGAITTIGRGAKELAIESTFVLSAAGVAETTAGAGDKASTTRMTILGSPTFRYFVADDFALSFQPGVFFESDTATTGGKDHVKQKAVGALGTLSASYYASLGLGMFVVPTLGVGGFVGTEDTHVPSGSGDLSIRSTRSGVALRGGLGLALYTSSHFNCFARPEVVALIGSHKTRDDANAAAAGVSTESKSFYNVVGGFTVGVSYVF